MVNGKYIIPKRFEEILFSSIVEGTVFSLGSIVVDFYLLNQTPDLEKAKVFGLFGLCFGGIKADQYYQKSYNI